ncbi:MAG: hypothetical protein ACYDC5_02045 [Candidatus Dormibacteria bacterium]
MPNRLGQAGAANSRRDQAYDGGLGIADLRRRRILVRDPPARRWLTVPLLAGCFPLVTALAAHGPTG